MRLVAVFLLAALLSCSEPVDRRAGRIEMDGERYLPVEPSQLASTYWADLLDEGDLFVCDCLVMDVGRELIWNQPVVQVSDRSINSFDAPLRSASLHIAESDFNRERQAWRDAGCGIATFCRAMVFFSYRGPGLRSGLHHIRTVYDGDRTGMFTIFLRNMQVLSAANSR